MGSSRWRNQRDGLSNQPGSLPPHDAGIAWDSIGFRWPVKEPVLSDRDRKFPALRDFQSPF